MIELQERRRLRFSHSHREEEEEEEEREKYERFARGRETTGRTYTVPI